MKETNNAPQGLPPGMCLLFNRATGKEKLFHAIDAKDVLRCFPHIWSVKNVNASVNAAQPFPPVAQVDPFIDATEGEGDNDDDDIDVTAISVDNPIAHELATNSVGQDEADTYNSKQSSKRNSRRRN